jgi:hypothetical protein
VNQKVDFTDFQKLTSTHWAMELRDFSYNDHSLASYAKHGHTLFKNNSMAVLDVSSAFISVPENVH